MVMTKIRLCGLTCALKTLASSMKTLKGTKQKKLMVMEKNHVVWSCGLKTSATHKRGCGLIVHVSHEIRVDFFYMMEKACLVIIKVK